MTAVKVLCSIALQDAVLGLKHKLEACVGCEVRFQFGVATTFKSAIEEGEDFDVALLTQSIIDKLASSGNIIALSIVDVAKSGLGLAVRLDAMKPDIGSVGALKATLLAAPSIASSKNGLAGVYFLDVLRELGITQQIVPKLKLETAGGYAAEIVARGDAELAVQLLSEILPVSGAALVGPFPAGAQKYAILTGGVSTVSKQKEKAAAIMQFLVSPEVDEVLQSRGLTRCL